MSDNEDYDEPAEEEEEEEELEEIIDEDLPEIDDDLLFGSTVPNIQVQRVRLGLPVLTKFEKARILGTRWKQLADGAPALIDVDPGMDDCTIALAEISARVLPVIVRRKHNDGTYDDWHLSELQVD